MSLNEKIGYGGGIFHLHTLENLADIGVSCLIPLSFNPTFEPRKNWDVRPLPIRRTFKLGALLSNLVFFFHLSGLWFIKKQRFEILRVSDPYYVGVAALLFSMITKVPTLGYVFHLDEGVPFQNRVIGAVCRRLSGVAVSSEFTKAQICHRFGLAAEDVFVTYGGVTRFPSDKSKGEAKKSLGISGKSLITFLGTLSERKNPEGALEIFAKIAADFPDAVMFICGAEEKGGAIGQKLAVRASELGLGSRVKITGRIDNLEKADVYKATDIFLFPSRLEGFGLAVVEAMAEGAPAIVSDRGSLPELIRDGETGFVRDPDDLDSSAVAAALLLRDRKKREEMGRAAARDVIDRFTWEKCARQTLKVHETILARAKERHLAVILNSGDSLGHMKRAGQFDRFLHYYIKGWAKRFDRVFVFSYGKDEDVFFGNTRFIPKPDSRKGLLHALLLPFYYAKILRGCSLVRVMQTQGALPAIISRVLYGTPFLLTYGYLYGDSMRIKGRPVYGLWLDILEQVALRLCAGVIVTTPSLYEHVENKTSPNKIHFIPNGVDVSRFCPSKEKTKSILSVLYVGRLEPHKKLDIVISALAPLKNIKVRLLVVGEGPEKEKWRAMCQNMELDHEFFGSVPYEKLPEVHRQAHVFVLPSLFEGHPKVLIEAFASGLACVGARSPGIVDVIEDGVTGLLAKPTVTDFAVQMVRLLYDGDLRERLGRAAREVAVSSYDLEKNLAMEMTLLENLGKGKPDGPK